MVWKAKFKGGVLSDGAIELVFDPLSGLYQFNTFFIQGQHFIHGPIGLTLGRNGTQPQIDELKLVMQSSKAQDSPLR